MDDALVMDTKEEIFEMNNVGAIEGVACGMHRRLLTRLLRHLPSSLT